METTIYCNECKHPRGPIGPAERPCSPRRAYIGQPAAVRCGVCGSANVRPLWRERYIVKVVGELWMGGRGATTYASESVGPECAADVKRISGDFARVLDYEVTRVRVSGDWTREVTEREVVRAWDDPESDDFFAEVYQ